MHENVGISQNVIFVIWIPYSELYKNSLYVNRVAETTICDEFTFSCITDKHLSYPHVDIIYIIQMRHYRNKQPRI